MIAGWLAIASALALEPLDVGVASTIEAPRPDVRGERVGRIPVATSDTAPVVDGRFDDPMWTGAEPAPLPLPAAASILRPTRAATFVATPAGLAIAHPPVDRGAALRLDPDGSARAWLALDLTAEGLTAAWCDTAGIRVDPPAPVAPRAAPCVAVAPPPHAVGPDGVELVVPWSALPGAATSMALAWGVRGDMSGGWAITRDPRARDITQARPTTLPRARARLDVTTTPTGPLVDVVRLGPDTTATVVGIARDDVALAPDGPSVRLDAHPGGRTIVVRAPDPDGGLPLGRTLPVPDPQAAVHVPVPAVRLAGVVELGFHTRRDLCGVVLRLWADGTPHAEARIDLPRGTGTISVRIPPGAPSPLAIEAVGLRPPVALHGDAPTTPANRSPDPPPRLEACAAAHAEAAS